jgi:hypothetical protein
MVSADTNGSGSKRCRPISKPAKKEDIRHIIFMLNSCIIYWCSILSGNLIRQMAGGDNAPAKEVVNGRSPHHSGGPFSSTSPQEATMTHKEATTHDYKVLVKS